MTEVTQADRAQEVEAAIAACHESANSQFGASGDALNRVYAAARACAAAEQAAAERDKQREATLRQLGENAAKAAKEYAERERELVKALEQIEFRSTNHGGWFDQPGQQFAEYCKLGDMAKSALAKHRGQA